jgi:hypothetical protein
MIDVSASSVLYQSHDCRSIGSEQDSLTDGTAHRARLPVRVPVAALIFQLPSDIGARHRNLVK